MVSIRTSLSVVSRLAFQGNRTGLISSELNVAHRCDSPVTVELQGCPDPVIEGSRAAVYSWWDKNMPSGFAFGKNALVPERLSRGVFYLDLQVPCRKCPSCLRWRSAMWAQRAFRECLVSKRTWFCTYTVNPAQRVRVRILARQKYGDESYASLYKVISQWFTLYLKRVRKESSAKLRYLLVSEQHADGFPHLHALIHEVDAQVSKRCLQTQWPYGFTVVKLADPLSSRYVTKYLAKQMVARVRASLCYGGSTPDTSYDIVTPQGERVSIDPLKAKF